MQSRLSKLTETILQSRGDIKWISLPTDDPDDFLEFFGGPDYFDDDCIYDVVDEATARSLLNDWLDDTSHVGWSIQCELSKLLAKRGNLVRERVEPIIRTLAALRPHEGGFTPWARHQLCLSFLHSLADGEALALRLLGRTPEDFRDGLLRPCYSINTRPIYETLKTSVRCWEGDGWCGSSTGERWLIYCMVERWDETFPGEDHADIRQLCRPVT